MVFYLIIEKNLFWEEWQTGETFLNYWMQQIKVPFKCFFVFPAKYLVCSILTLETWV